MGNAPSSSRHGGNNNNSHSNNSRDNRTSVRQLLRNYNQGTLGLSKIELDERCKPSGLYPSCPWDEKAIRRLIGDGKLAARSQVGSEVRSNSQNIECPICFLQYNQVNITKCCQAHICTECFLQVSPQGKSNSSSSSSNNNKSVSSQTSACPFCNHAKFQVRIAEVMDAKAIYEREKEEQRVVEAQIRAMNSSSNKKQVSPDTTADSSNNLKSDDGDNSENTFGSSLAEHDRTAAWRERSGSLSSSLSAKHDSNELAFAEEITSIAMTPQEREAIEAAMKAQKAHPLAQQIQAEEDMRRYQNDQDYYRSQAGRMRELRALQEFSRRRSRSANNNAELLQALANSNPRAGGRDWTRIVEAFENHGNGSVSSVEDLVVLEAAIMLSMEEARRRGEVSDPTSFDAIEHAAQGFPLARARVQHADNSADAELERYMGGQLRDLSRRSRRSRPDAFGPVGMSEEEQIAMAIAASIEDQQRQEAMQQQEAENTQQSEDALQQQTETTLTSNNSENASTPDEVTTTESVAAITASEQVFLDTISTNTTQDVADDTDTTVQEINTGVPSTTNNTNNDAIQADNTDTGNDTTAALSSTDVINDRGEASSATMDAVVAGIDDNSEIMNETSLPDVSELAISSSVVPDSGSTATSILPANVAEDVAIASVDVVEEKSDTVEDDNDTKNDIVLSDLTTAANADNVNDSKESSMTDLHANVNDQNETDMPPPTELLSDSKSTELYMPEIEKMSAAKHNSNNVEILDAHTTAEDA